MDIIVYQRQRKRSAILCKIHVHRGRDHSVIPRIFPITPIVRGTSFDVSNHALEPTNLVPLRRAAVRGASGLARDMVGEMLNLLRVGSRVARVEGRSVGMLPGLLLRRGRVGGGPPSHARGHGARSGCRSDCFGLRRHCRGYGMNTRGLTVGRQQRRSLSESLETKKSTERSGQR